MSVIDNIMTNISKISGYRNSIRTKLTSMGLGTANDSLETCTDNIQGIVDNTKKTTTGTAISYPYYTGSGGSVYGKGNAGYNSSETMIKIPVTNLTPGNIKKGVNIGGVVGTLEPMPDEMSYTADGFKPYHNRRYPGISNNISAYLSKGLAVAVYSKNTSYKGGIWLLNAGSSSIGYSNTTTIAITKKSNTSAIVLNEDGNNGSTSAYYTSNGGTSWTEVNRQGLYNKVNFISNGSSFMMRGMNTGGTTGTVYTYTSTDGSSWTSITPTVPTRANAGGGYSYCGDYMSGYYYSILNEERYYNSSRNSQILYVYRSSDLINWTLAYGEIDLGYHTTDWTTRGESFYKLGNLLVLRTSGGWEYTLVSKDNGVTWDRLRNSSYDIIDYKGRIYLWAQGTKDIVVLSTSGVTTVTLSTSATPLGIGCLSNKFVVMYEGRYDVMSDVY